MPSDKPYNTIEDINEDFDTDHFVTKTTPKMTLNGQIKTLVLPVLSREHVVFSNRIRNKRIKSRTFTWWNGDFTKNSLLGMNINLAFEQAMGYRNHDAVHILRKITLEDHLADCEKRTCLKETFTPVEVLLPEHSMTLINSLPKTENVAHARAEDFDHINYSLAGQNKNAVYTVATDLFSERVSISLRKNESEVSQNMKLMGEGHFVLMAADTGDVDFKVEPTLSNKKRSVLMIKKHERTWYIDVEDLSEGSTIDFIVTGSENSTDVEDKYYTFVKTEEPTMVMLDEDQQMKHLGNETTLLKQSALKYLHNSLPEVEHKAIHDRDLTLMLSNHAWEVGTVRVTLTDATEFEVKLRDTATTELNLAHSVNEIESIEFNNTKTNQWLSKNKFTQTQLKDYVNASSKVAQLCAELSQPPKDKMFSHLKACSLKQKNFAKAGTKPVVHEVETNEYRLQHSGLEASDYRTIDLWNESNKKSTSFYLTATYELDGHIYPLALGTQINRLSKSGYNLIDKIHNDNVNDGSKVRLYVPKDATLKTLSLTAIHDNEFKEIDVLDTVAMKDSENQYLSLSVVDLLILFSNQHTFGHSIKEYNSFALLSERARKKWKDNQNKLNFWESILNSFSKAIPQVAH